LELGIEEVIDEAAAAGSSLISSALAISRGLTEAERTTAPERRRADWVTFFIMK
jgi:hypothetical protein